TLSTSSGSAFVCGYESITFTAFGADLYEFFVNGISQGAASAVNSITLDNLADGQAVNVMGTSNNTGCNQTSEFPFTVLQLSNAEFVPDTDTAICAGDTLMLQGNYTKGNQWLLNGVAIPGATNA